MTHKRGTKRRDERFYAIEVDGEMFAEMQERAIEVFEKNLSTWRGSMDRALGAAYLDGVVTGALFVLKRQSDGTWKQ